VTRGKGHVDALDKTYIPYILLHQNSNSALHLLLNKVGIWVSPKRDVIGFGETLDLIDYKPAIPDSGNGLPHIMSATPADGSDYINASFNSGYSGYSLGTSNEGASNQK